MNSILYKLLKHSKKRSLKFFKTCTLKRIKRKTSIIEKINKFNVFEILLRQLSVVGVRSQDGLELFLYGYNIQI